MAGALLLVAALLSAGDAAAREDGAPAASLGRADAVRASAVAADGLFFNPAGMSLIRQFSLSAHYAYQHARAGHAMGAMAVDSATNEVVAMGLGYTYITSEPGGLNRTGSQIRGGISAAYRTPQFGVFFGVAGNYTALDVDLGDAGSQQRNFFTIDAGLILDFARIVRFGVVGQNLIDSKTVVEAPRRLGIGAAFTVDAFEAEVNADLDFQTVAGEVTPSYGVALQYVFAGMVVARAGLAIDGMTSDKSVTVGLGYVSPTFGVDVGYSQPVTGDTSSMTLAAAIKFFIPPLGV